MASPRLAGLEQRLSDLAECFIVRKSDFSLYTRADHDMATAYVLLASAAIENYVEQRCLEVAQRGCDRFQRGQPTTAGRAVLEWHILRCHFRRNKHGTVPIDDRDLQEAGTQIPEAAAAYMQEVNKVHGIDGSDFAKLVYAVGVREWQVPSLLREALDDLAARRDPASHTPVNRAKTLSEPAIEQRKVEQILGDLRLVDGALEVVEKTYPVNR